MSIIETAVAEMNRAGFSKKEKQVLVSIMEQFFDQWDSGGAVSVMIPVLTRLLSGQPLSPLTGEDDEWNDVSEHASQKPMYQNKRCSTVFKTVDRHGNIFVYDIDLPRKAGQFQRITFPYLPETKMPQSPLVEVG